MTDLNTAKTLLSLAKKAGAEHAEVLLAESTQISTSVRMGALEEMERAESTGIGLRVFMAKSQASVSASNLQQESLERIAEQAVSIANLAPDDPCTGLATPELLANALERARELQLIDAHEPTPEWLREQCEEAEDAARAVAGITNSDGASAGYSKGGMGMITSDGFEGAYRKTSFSISASVIAGSGDAMETDYAYQTTRFCSDLPSPAALGKEAAERTVQRLNPRKQDTCQLPVIYEPRIGKQMLGYLAGAISGAAVARGTSFLKDKRETLIFAPGISIIDDPLRLKGLGSSPFDDEGCRNAPLELVKDGVLQHWLLDTRSARQLEMTANGRASRGMTGPPSPSATNLYMQPGLLSPKALMAEVSEGFYVTDTFGMGVNLITGDYSQGASGFWIKNGELTHAVSEVTIAATLPEMFKGLTAANDLHFQYGTNVPTLRIERMTIAGN